MAKVKIMRKELVWDIFCATDGSKVGVFKGDIINDEIDEKLLKKMFSIVSLYYDDSYKNFYDNFDNYIAFVGLSEECDYYSMEKYYKATLEGEIECLFYAVFHNEWNIVEIEADYFDVQEWGYDDDASVMAAFPNYDSAIKYCYENDINITNIVPQKWGHHESLD